MQQSAQGWARTRLTHAYSLEYRKLYEEEKLTARGANARQKAASRAKIRLTHKYPEKYKELYKEAVRRGFARRNA